jgi:hypothetical protein
MVSHLLTTQIKCDRFVFLKGVPPCFLLAGTLQF